LQELRDDYSFSVNITAGLTGLADMYYRMNDRPYAYTKSGGKAASFAAVLTNPQPNEFKYTDQFNPTNPPAPYSLPNDLYREYLQYRGKYIARALRGANFLTTTLEPKLASIKSEVERAQSDEELTAAYAKASGEIQVVFEEYDKLVSKALTEFEESYQTGSGVSWRPEDRSIKLISRDGHLRQMVERGILKDKELEKIKVKGFIPPETKKPQ
jgi:hypothetical protein